VHTSKAAILTPESHSANRRAHRVRLSYCQTAETAIASKPKAQRGNFNAQTTKKPTINLHASNVMPAEAGIQNKKTIAEGDTASFHFRSVLLLF